jgi:thiamine pyrophosphokinase
VKVVVVAGGDVDPRDADLLRGAELVIAADGGAAFLESIGRAPDLLVGDLDSADAALVARLSAAGVTVERHPAAKDATDAELALDRAVAAGARRVTVIGAFAGARLDHELANLLLLTDPAWGAALDDLRMVRGGTMARAVHGPASLDLEASLGATVSLLPVGGDARGVRTVGLEFPLSGETLRLGRSRGVSNVVAAAPASVSLDDGVLLVIETGKEIA